MPDSSINSIIEKIKKMNTLLKQPVRNPHRAFNEFPHDLMTGVSSRKNNKLTTSSAESFQENFFQLSVDNLTKDYREKDPQDLMREGEMLALKLFHKAAERVPAYKDFLQKNSIDHRLIRTIDDFKRVPIIDKKNYLRAYSLKELCWDGKIDNLYVLSSSSGSTGEPFMWPRGEEQELEGGLNFELIFKEIFEAHKYKTLYIVCFAMGTWISGPFVLACAEYLNRKGYPVLTVTPGLDTSVTYSLFKNLADQFDQIVISGYPPYIKDILDGGKANGINWKKYKIKFLFAAEGFSEKWRKYVLEQVGAKNHLTASVNIYGSADAAILAYETPVATAIRQAIAVNSKYLQTFFGDSRTPTLAQYDPRLKYFENVEGKLIFTTRSGLPLVRYSIGDNGGLFAFQEMETKLSTVTKKSLADIMKTNSCSDKLWKLPFVYLFGRADFTVSLYGLLIYPEHIKYGLESKKLQKYLTGKFTMSIEFSESQDPYLLIRVEMAEGVKASSTLVRTIEKEIINGLEEVNSEYNRLLDSVGKRACPVIELYEHGNVEYFRKGAKQKWTLKQ